MLTALFFKVRQKTIKKIEGEVNVFMSMNLYLKSQTLSYKVGSLLDDVLSKYWTLEFDSRFKTQAPCLWTPDACRLTLDLKF